MTKDSIEESIIDFVITSSGLEREVESLIIDEAREHVLMKITRNKRGVKKIESDHNVLISRLKLRWSKVMREERNETFNLKNIDCQKVFKKATSNNTDLSSIFDSKNDINSCAKKFMKRLNGYIHECFRKVRISEKTNSAIDELFKKRRKLRGKSDEESKNELAKVDEELANKCAEDNRQKILEEISGIESEEGGVNSGKLWRLKKKLRDPPPAMLDHLGNLVTSPKAIET